MTAVSTTSATPKTAADRSDEPTRVRSVFEGARDKIFCHRFHVELCVDKLVGGTPTDPNVAEGWIRTKMGLTSEELISAEVEQVMQARGVTADQAVEVVARNRNLSGFKRDFTTPIARNAQHQATTRGARVLTSDGKTQVHRVFTPEEAARTFGECYIEGRQIKAMLKENAMVAVAAGGIEGKGWGATRKGMLNFLVEHLFVEEQEIFLGVTDPDFVNQSFVHTFRGSGIKLEEVLLDAVLSFTLAADFDFPDKDADFFEQVMVRAEYNGLGASRSQGFGTFKTTKFERLEPVKAKK